MSFCFFDVKYSPDGKQVIVTNIDGSFRFFSETNLEELIAVYPIAHSDWAVMHPSGLFDASHGAMDKMYYLVGQEVIELEQLKERYYEPGLYQKVLGYDDGPLREVEQFKSLAMYPRIQSPNTWTMSLPFNESFRHSVNQLQLVSQIVEPKQQLLLSFKFSASCLNSTATQ